GYVEAALIGYPDGWWQTLLNLSAAFGTMPSSGIVLVPASDQVYDCRFVFARDGKTLGVIACDEVFSNEKWLNSAAARGQEFLQARKLDKAVLIGRLAEPNLPDSLPKTPITLVIE